MRRLMGVLIALSVSSASAGTITYVTSLSGAAEFPPTGSPGIGTSTLLIDPDAHTMNIQIDFSGLIGNTTAAHIHAPTPVPNDQTASVATQLPSFVGFPLNVTSGTYNQTFDLLDASSYNPSFINNQGGGTPAGAEAALLQFLAEGRAYLNIHTTEVGSGEIRGFYAVPEPGSLALLAGLGFAAVARRR